MATLADRPLERLERREYASQMTMAMFGRQISWPAIAAGVVAGAFIYLVLGTLGGAIGFSAVASDTGLAAEAGIGVSIWLMVSTIVAMFAGGWVAGRTSGIPRKSAGMMHGFLSASLGTLFIMAILASAIGGVFGTAANLVGSGLQVAGNESQVATEASSVVDNAQAEFNATTPAERNLAADRAATGTAAAGFGLFLMLLLAGGSSIAGGYVSTANLNRGPAPQPRI